MEGGQRCHFLLTRKSKKNGVWPYWRFTKYSQMTSHSERNGEHLIAIKLSNTEVYLKYNLKNQQKIGGVYKYRQVYIFESFVTLSNYAMSSQNHLLPSLKYTTVLTDCHLAKSRLT